MNRMVEIAKRMWRVVYVILSLAVVLTFGFMEDKMSDFWWVISVVAIIAIGMTIAPVMDRKMSPVSLPATESVGKAKQIWRRVATTLSGGFIIIIIIGFFLLVGRAVENQMFPNEWAVVLILVVTVPLFLWVWLRVATIIHHMISSDPVEQAAAVMFHTGSAFCVSSLLNNAGEIRMDGIIQYFFSILHVIWANPEALLGFCAAAACLTHHRIQPNSEAVAGLTGRLDCVVKNLGAGARTRFRLRCTTSCANSPAFARTPRLAPL